MKLRQIILVAGIYFVTASIAFAYPNFPLAPDLELTPGALCKNPKEYRYPEQIPYCDRDVNSDEKWVIISKYMKKLRFTINNSNRADFKIDHYIPLCMGGANTIENLWPQNQVVYQISDPLEVILCQKLAAGRITQKFAIEKIKQGKANYLSIPAMIRDLGKIR